VRTVNFFRAFSCPDFFRSTLRASLVRSWAAATEQAFAASGERD
jgi:hypothetical protein